MKKPMPLATTFTPGPWSINSTESHGEACAYAAVIIGAEAAGEPCVASLEFGGAIETDTETTKANAQLIAAAPELHAALYALANYFEVHTMDTGRTSRGEEVWQAARAAIAKAEGRA